MTRVCQNMAAAHRAARLLIGLAAAAAGLTLLPAPGSWAAAAAGCGLALTGLIGWCPACAACRTGQETRP